MAISHSHPMNNNSDKMLKRVRNGISLPPEGMEIVQLDDCTWKIINSEGFDQERINAFKKVVRYNLFSVEIAAEAVEKLKLCNNLQRASLHYSGFMIAHLYLEHLVVSVSQAERAVRFCYPLIRFFQHVTTYDSRANFIALPMLWRSYWQALTVLVKEWERLLEEVNSPDDAKSRVDYTKRLAAVGHTWLSGWHDYLIVEHNSAQNEWRAICQNVQQSQVFWQQLALWINTSPQQQQKLPLDWFEIWNIERHRVGLSRVSAVQFKEVNLNIEDASSLPLLPTQMVNLINNGSIHFGNSFSFPGNTTNSNININSNLDNVTQNSDTQPITSAMPHHKSALNPELRSHLVELLVLSIPITKSREGRDSLLHGIDGADRLNRDEGNQRHDTEMIIDQLNQWGRLQSGNWPLALLIANAQAGFEEYKLWNELEALRQEIIQKGA